MPNERDPRDRGPEVEAVPQGTAWPPRDAADEGEGAEYDTEPDRCIRCRKVITNSAREIFFESTGLCFWCAYVDAQG